MATLPLMTVLGGLLAVPCIIAIAQGTEKVTKIFAGVGAAVGLWIGLHRHVDILRDLTNGSLSQVLGILAVSLAVVVAVRLKHQILGTLMITAGSLIALLTLDIVS